MHLRLPVIEKRCSVRTVRFPNFRYDKLQNFHDDMQSLTEHRVLGERKPTKKTFRNARITESERLLASASDSEQVRASASERVK
jgi:PBP1b-binding outer membrane lipoprotein LpoB